MSPWTRWNVVAIIAGVWLFISPWALTLLTEPHSVWNFWIVGILMVVVGVVALANPAMVEIKYAALVLGIWLFLSPWILGYSAVASAAWNAWVVGIIAVIVAALAISAARQVQEGAERRA